MSYILIILMIATLITVITGFSFLAFNKNLNLKYGNKLMTVRILLQVLSIILLLLIYIAKKSM